MSGRVRQVAEAGRARYGEEWRARFALVVGLSPLPDGDFGGREGDGWDGYEAYACYEAWRLVESMESGRLKGPGDVMEERTGKAGCACHPRNLGGCYVRSHCVVVLRMGGALGTSKQCSPGRPVVGQCQRVFAQGMQRLWNGRHNLSMLAVPASLIHSPAGLQTVMARYMYLDTDPSIEIPGTVAGFRMDQAPDFPGSEFGPAVSHPRADQSNVQRQRQQLPAAQG